MSLGLGKISNTGVFIGVVAVQQIMFSMLHVTIIDGVVCRGCLGGCAVWTPHPSFSGWFIVFGGRALVL